MGVDFDRCKMCGDVKCTDSLRYIRISWNDYGNYTVCKYCLPKYFEDANKDGIEDEIIAESGMIFFAAKKKEAKEDEDVEYKKDDILFYAETKFELLEQIEEGIQYVYSFYDNEDEQKKIEQDKDHDYFFYDTDELDLCFGEAYDTYIAQELKKGNDILSRYEEDYDGKEYVPINAWKEYEKSRLQKKMKEIKLKLSKFS